MSDQYDDGTTGTGRGWTCSNCGNMRYANSVHHCPTHTAPTNAAPQDSSGETRGARDGNSPEVSPPAVSAPDDLVWLHKFINCTSFGKDAPLRDMERAHQIAGAQADRIEQLGEECQSLSALVKSLDEKCAQLERQVCVYNARALVKEERALKAEAKLAAMLPTCAVCGRKTPCEDDTPCTFDPTPKALYEDNCRLRAELAAAQKRTALDADVELLDQVDRLRRELAAAQERAEKATIRALGLDERLGALMKENDTLRRAQSDAERAEAELAAAQAVPEGWVMVPREPTEAMLDAAQLPSRPRDVYRAMLAAAPTNAAPQDASEGEGKPVAMLGVDSLKGVTGLTGSELGHTPPSPAVSAPDDLVWLYKFMGCTLFGGDVLLRDMERAHQIVGAQAGRIEQLGEECQSLSTMVKSLDEKCAQQEAELAAARSRPDEERT